MFHPQSLCLIQDDPPTEIIEYLVPRPHAKETEKLEESDDEEQDDLEDCSIVETEQRIKAIEKEMNKLSEELQMHELVHDRKLRHLKYRNLLAD